MTDTNVTDTTVENVNAEEEHLKNLSPEQREIYELMKADKKFVAVQGIMKMKNQLKQMETIKESAINNVKTMLPDDKISIIEARTDVIDLAVLESLDMRKDEDWEKVREVYTVDDDIIEFSTKPTADKIKVREMHRDYLIFIKKLREESAKYEIAEKEYKESIAKLEDDLSQALGAAEASEILKKSSFGEFYIEWINKTLERDDISENVRKNLEKIKNYDERGIKLDFLKEEIIRLREKTGNTSSLMHGFRHNFEETAKKVNKIMSSGFEKYSYHLAFEKFYDIEKRFFANDIDEKYNNLFMFILFRFIKNNHNTFNNFWMITIGEIVTQLGFLARPEDERPSTSKEFINNFKEVIKLAINE